MNNSMEMKRMNEGSFTLPGEAGYEDLTVQLARIWGADSIRDSDGTELSDKILALGVPVYSTICLVRSDNAWAKANPDKLQQNYLMSRPVMAETGTVAIELLKGYFREQFRVNTSDNPGEWWQVFDRSTGQEVPVNEWDFDADAGVVTVRQAHPWHQYTVNFLAFRLWEEISMYNHITNNWGDREHLMAIDPIYPEARDQMLRYLENWLVAHPKTSIVRFTSMFYNFTWFWGDDPNLRYLYSDWADYQMMVSPAALRAFEQTRGYRLTSEDFVNGGLYRCTHNVPTPRYRDWMAFINDFVIGFGRQCVDLVHRHKRKAYVFYDDHWVGVEPWGERFKEFGFDGLIKCVFNAFEARLCAGVKDVGTRELRLHPYLFPTGLKGEPTFKEGGNPALDAAKFWINIRRALLREPVDRIGLGGYLHLVEGYPDFVDYIGKVAREFRQLKEFHKDGKPYVAPFKVAVLTAWGRLRSWICSGHMTPGLELNELIESLAGLPVEVEFISFDDIRKHGVPTDVKVLINCGRDGSAWSGGDNWADPAIVGTITGWVAKGGGFIGIAEPSAARQGSQFFQLAPVLGLDRDLGRRIGHGKYRYAKPADGHFITRDLDGELDFGKDIDGIFAVSSDASVLADRDDSPRLASHAFGKGHAVYLSGYRFNAVNTRLIHRAIAWAAGQESEFKAWTCGNINTECAYYPAQHTLVVINNSGERQVTDVYDGQGNPIQVSLDPYDIKILNP